MKNIWKKIIYLFTAIACLFSIGCKEEKDEKSKTNVKEEEMNEKNTLVMQTEKELPEIRAKIYSQDIEKVKILMSLDYDSDVEDDDLTKYHKENQDEILSKYGLDKYSEYQIKQYNSNNVYYRIPYSKWNETIKNDFEKAKQELQISYISRYNTVYSTIPSINNLKKIDYKELEVKGNIKQGIYTSYEDYEKDNEVFIDKSLFDNNNLIVTEPIYIPYMNIKKEINGVYLNNGTIEICEKTYEPLVTVCALKEYKYVLLIPKKYDVKDVSVRCLDDFDKIKTIRDIYYKTYTLSDIR